ncbi:hypothetical protein O0L34_g3563 [Tuta absoluta]|nr:hypothetical protein O0L34_g3563 [Tuta absoluta]
MKTWIFLFAVVGFASCRPEPGFFRDLAELLGRNNNRAGLSTFAQNLLDAFTDLDAATKDQNSSVLRTLAKGDAKAAGTLLGSAVASTAAVVHGKLEAVKNAEQGIGNVLTGNFSAAAHNIGNALGDVVAGDLAGAAIMGTGIARASGQVIGSKLQATNALLATGAKAAGQVAAGKLEAAADISAGLNSLASSNLAAATTHFTDAVGSVVAGDAAGLSTMFGL